LQCKNISTIGVFPRWQLRRSCPDENKVDWPLYSPKNLHNRWDPRRHPLYCLAATGQTRVAALDSIVQTSRSDVLHTPGQQAVEVENLKFDTSDEVNAISQFSYVGKSETQRYHEAKNLFDSAFAKASKNETQYKHFMACLKVGETDCNQHPSHQRYQRHKNGELSAIKMLLTWLRKRKVRRLANVKIACSFLKYHALIIEEVVDNAHVQLTIGHIAHGRSGRHTWRILMVKN